MFPSLAFRVFYDGTSLMGIGSRDVGETLRRLLYQSYLRVGGYTYN